MKRHQPLLALGLAAALFTLTGSAQTSQAEQDLEQRVEALEKQLEQARAESDGLASALAENSEALDQLKRWAEGQAKAAASMARTLDSAEQQGFTVGINFKSRETLLAGWRSTLNQAQQGLGKERAGAGEVKARGR